MITGIRASVPLLGHPRTLGEAIHIASDHVLTWNQIADALPAAWTVLTTTSRDILAVARRLADDLLFPEATRVDRLDVLPVAQLDALAAEGLYGAPVSGAGRRARPGPEGYLRGDGGTGQRLSDHGVRLAAASRAGHDAGRRGYARRAAPPMARAPSARARCAAASRSPA